jgi:RNA polymerase sigma-70 factor, ECF subfamily
MGRLGFSSVQDEQTLLRGLRAGDEQAFELLLDRHDGAMRRVARSFLRTPSAVEEVVAETWLAVVKGLDSFEGRSSLQTWLFRILVNRARTRAVRDARQITFSSLEDDEHPAVDPSAFGEDGRWRSAPSRLEFDPETRLLSGELRGELVSAIDGLPDQQRVVVTLRDVVGLSAAEVCEMLEITEVNQRVLLHRGRARCRAVLAAHAQEHPR